MSVVFLECFMADEKAVGDYLGWVVWEWRLMSGDTLGGPRPQDEGSFGLLTLITYVVCGIGG